MGKFIETLNNVRNNDIKAINKSIENVGRKHHVEYMVNMMFANDIDINQQLLIKIQNAVNCFYEAVSENFLIKQSAQDMLNVEGKNSSIIKKDFNLLTSEQISKIVYQQAMRYYFRIDVENQLDFRSYFDETLKYRIISNFLKSDIESILIRMYEDIEVIVEDTKNIKFLMRNYKKLNRVNGKYHFILEQLAKSIYNVVFQDNRFEEEYFNTVRKISVMLCQSFMEE